MGDRVALVTGASRGIGMGIALELARTGWNIAMTYHENEGMDAQGVTGLMRSASTIEHE